MVTYNHEQFVAKAIESVVMQEADFPFEVIIGEDYSTDGTRAIVVEYAQRFPNIVHPLLHNNNLGLQGARNFQSVMAKCRGNYVAILEGDDYWTDPHKLQKQVDFLDSHPEYTICSHNVDVLEQATGNFYSWGYADQPEHLTLKDVLRNGSCGATCSLLFRRKMFDALPDWYTSGQVHGGDWTLQVLCTSRGPMRYLPEKMGVYRRHAAGARYHATTAAAVRGHDATAISSKNALHGCDVVDAHFSYRYTRDLNSLRSYWLWIGGLDFMKAGCRRTALYWMLRSIALMVPRVPTALRGRDLAGEFFFVATGRGLPRMLRRCLPAKLRAHG